MKKRIRSSFLVATIYLLAFVLWTVLVIFVDVQPIGPQGSTVGFAKLNGFVHELTGVHMSLYNVTDWLGLVPISVVLCFAIFGLAQWISRRSIAKVDRSLWVLAGFYMVVMAVFIFFEIVVINYRPVLIDGNLEASYPSSTTMLVMCVMPTAMMQLKSRVQSRVLSQCLSFVISGFTAFMVIGRLVSGVHWLTDIVGGVLISSGLVMMYYSSEQIICRSRSCDV